MRNYYCLNHLALSMVTTVTVFLLTMLFSPSTHAAVTTTYDSKSAAPIVLAWYHRGYWGNGYRGAFWRGGYRNSYGYRCARTCFINRWGNRECVRSCN